MATFFLDFDNGQDVAYGDLSSANRVPTANGAPALSSAVKKFGNYSLDLTTVNASSGISYPNGSLLQFGAGQFTVEAWGYLVATNGSASLVGTWTGTTALGWSLNLNASNVLVLNYSTTGANTLTVASTYTPPLNTWVHYAADRDASGVIRLYANGVVVASATDTSTLFATTLVCIVGNVQSTGTWRWNGYIGEVRVTKGVARYAGAFTPPTAAFPRNATLDAQFGNVALLVQFWGNGTGTNFLDRWQTVTNGATAARIAAGDEIRIMGSPDPILVGNATWTQYSKDVVLASAVTATISNCATLWTASANVTCGVTTGSFKEGTSCSTSTIATAFTTGKVSYSATGTLDLSAYQQVSFWVQSNVALAAGLLSLRLCSDATGTTTVNTIPIPALNGPNQWIPITVDLGTNLGSAIASVALYADADPGSVSIIFDNIIACKASSAPDSLTLTSLIGKVCNLSWAASTAYATGDERKPTQPMRNGFRYKATTGGTTGGTEPTWPQEIGATVTDGAVTWKCVDLEDTWFPIQSINGTTVKIDNINSTLGNAGRGYAGNTETVATYRREAIKMPMNTSQTTGYVAPQKAGTAAAPISMIGGWDRTSMSTRNLETWLDAQNGQSFICGSYSSSTGYHYYENINGVRANIGFQPYAENYCTLKNSHLVGCVSGIAVGSAVVGMSLLGVNLSNAGSAINGNVAVGFTAVRALTVDSAINYGLFYGATNTAQANFVYTYINARNNGAYAFYTQYPMDTIWSNLVTGNNATGAMNLSNTPKTTLYNCAIPEATPFSSNGLAHVYAYSQKHQQTDDNHYIYTDGGTIVSAIDQRHTASGISWKFRPAATSRNSTYPLKLSLGQRLVKAGVPVSVTIWTRRDNVAIKGLLVVAGGQVSGVPNDVVVDCQPAVNTWVQSSTLTFTPTETGVVGISFKVFDGVTTTSNFWVGDLAVTGA